MKFFILTLFLLLFYSCGEKEKNLEEQSLSKFLSDNGTIELIDPYARPATKGMNSAVFVKINNLSDSEDTLFRAESDIAELVEVHETYKVNEDKMGMRHVEFLIIPAHSEVLLKPRSFHIMLINLVHDLPIDSMLKVKLIFKNAGEIELEVPVKDMNMK